MTQLLIIAVVISLLLCNCSPKVVEPIPLESKDLGWNLGDRKVDYILYLSPNDTSWYDTATVTKIAEVGGYRTISWTYQNGRVVQERIRDGVFETQSIYDDQVHVWTGHAKLPSFPGEILLSEEFTRIAPDGSNLGRHILEWLTASVDTTITVPAGTFRCLASVTKLYTLDHVQTDGFEIQHWYAPGIGYVQIETHEVTLSGGRKSTLSWRTQLQSY